METVKRQAGFASQGWLGLMFLAVGWPLNWMLPGTRTAWLFFPLWLGYILTVDALVQGRTGRSLWSRSRRGFAGLFVASSAVWWLFEAINARTQNWEYVGRDEFGPLAYHGLCTLCFSTVMPAVFETAELVRTFRWLDRWATGARIRPRRGLAAGLLLGGLCMLTLALLWPKSCYPLVWISLALILDPLNRWLGRRNILDWLQAGDWRPLISLSTGALICGFFWEMWNYWSYPKWIYHTPGAQFLHLFEMPLPGYAGYVPFALELYALKNFLWPRGPALRL
jgi:hypothetical protein